MNQLPTICIAMSGDADCRAKATMTDPVPLCGEHQLQVALAIVPDILVAELRQASAGGRPVSLPAEERAAVIAGARPLPVRAHMGRPHGPVVYFADAGTRIKIGFSTSLRNRIRSLSMQEKDVVLLLEGGLTLERALHDTYAKERIDSTEWFTKSDRLMNFIGSKLAELGGQDQRKTRQRRVVVTALGAGPASAKREDRLVVVRKLIRDVGGDPANLPLKVIQDRFAVSQPTASRIRAEASRQEA